MISLWYLDNLFSQWHLLISAVQPPHFFTSIQQRMFLCLCETAMENITIAKLVLPAKITAVFLVSTKMFCLRKSAGLVLFFFEIIFLLCFNIYLTVSSLFICLTASPHNVNSFGEDGN